MLLPYFPRLGIDFYIISPFKRIIYSGHKGQNPHQEDEDEKKCYSSGFVHRVNCVKEIIPLINDKIKELLRNGS